MSVDVRIDKEHVHPDGSVTLTIHVPSGGLREAHTRRDDGSVCFAFEASWPKPQYDNPELPGYAGPGPVNQTFRNGRWVPNSTVELLDALDVIRRFIEQRFT